MANQHLSPIKEWHDVDDATFKNEIITQYQPAVLRGFMRQWPAVQHALKSPETVCKYLMALDNGTDVDALMTPPKVKGRIFYSEDMNGFNYIRNRLPISAVINQLARYLQFPQPPSVAIQSALIADCMPAFAAENRLTALNESVLPRIWIGNAITTPAHFDQSNNVACVVSGRRRFTLFPPQQVGNLYIGPLDYAPTPSPISMVDFKNPDFQRFPKFREAQAVAQCTELGPGDAIYIPTLWWHHVESLDTINILVNYWWGDSGNDADKLESPFDCLKHCLLNMKHLSPEHRAAWGAMFQHYVFNPAENPVEHIPEHRRGILK